MNLAARIEAATKMYRLPILMSSTFAIELSPYAQSYLRLLDRVTVSRFFSLPTLPYPTHPPPPSFYDPWQKKKALGRERGGCASVVSG